MSSRILHDPAQHSKSIDSVLSLHKVEHHPAMADVLSTAESLSAHCEGIERQIFITKQEIVLLRQSTTAESGLKHLVPEAEARLATLERKHDEARQSSRDHGKLVRKVRAKVQAELLPKLRELALPHIEQELAALDAYLAVERLLGLPVQSLDVRQINQRRRIYLEALKQALTQIEEPEA